EAGPDPIWRIRGYSESAGHHRKIYAAEPARENSLSAGVFSFSRHEGKTQRGRTRLVVINQVGGFHHARGASLFFAGVHVAVEAREITAGDFQPELVPRQEHIAGSPQI